MQIETDSGASLDNYWKTELTALERDDIALTRLGIPKGLGM